MKFLILECLKKFNVDGFYIADSISQKKEQNARISYEIPKDEQVLGLVDATVWGSAKNGLAIGLNGIYWNNDWTTKTLKKHLPWELMEIENLRLDGSSLILSPGCPVDLAGSSAKPKDLLAILIKLLSVTKINAEKNNEKVISLPAPDSAIELPLENQHIPITQKPAPACLTKACIDDLIIGCLRTFNYSDLFVGGAIPEKRVKNARVSYEIPTDEQVLGLVDATVFGSAKHGLAIGLRGIYWNNDWTTKTVKKSLQWEHLKVENLSIKDADLVLAPGCLVNLAASTVKPKDLMAILVPLISVINDNDGAYNKTVAISSASAISKDFADEQPTASADSKPSASDVAWEVSDSSRINALIDSLLGFLNQQAMQQVVKALPGILGVATSDWLRMEENISKLATALYRLLPKVAKTFVSEEQFIAYAFNRKEALAERVSFLLQTPEIHCVLDREVQEILEGAFDEYVESFTDAMADSSDDEFTELMFLELVREHLDLVKSIELPEESATSQLQTALMIFSMLHAYSISYLPWSFRSSMGKEALMAMRGSALMYMEIVTKIARDRAGMEIDLENFMPMATLLIDPRELDERNGNFTTQIFQEMGARNFYEGVFVIFSRFNQRGIDGQSWVKSSQEIAKRWFLKLEKAAISDGAFD